MKTVASGQGTASTFDTNYETFVSMSNYQSFCVADLIKSNPNTTKNKSYMHKSRQAFCKQVQLLKQKNLVGLHRIGKHNAKYYRLTERGIFDILLNCPMVFLTNKYRIWQYYSDSAFFYSLLYQIVSKETVLKISSPRVLSVIYDYLRICCLKTNSWLNSIDTTRYKVQIHKGQITDDKNKNLGSFLLLVQNYRNLRLRKNRDNTLSIMGKAAFEYPLNQLNIDLNTLVKDSGHSDTSVDALNELGYMLPFNLILSYRDDIDYQTIFKDNNFRNVVNKLFKYLEDHRKIIDGSIFL
jgi:hypothetical protein